MVMNHFIMTCIYIYCKSFFAGYYIVHRQIGHGLIVKQLYINKKTDALVMN